MYGFAAALYGNGKQDLAYFLDSADEETIECETGVTQGCGLGTLLFALAFHECITSRSWKKYYFKLSTLRVQSFAWWASTGGHSLEITRSAQYLDRRRPARVSAKVCGCSFVLCLEGNAFKMLKKSYGTVVECNYIASLSCAKRISTKF